jgi:hypothetical protein
MKYYLYDLDLDARIPHPTLDQFNELKTLQFSSDPVRLLDSYFMFYLLEPRDPVSVAWLTHGYLHLHPGTSRFIGVALRPGYHTVPARLLTDQRLTVPWEGFRNTVLADTLKTKISTQWDWSKRAKDPVMRWALVSTHAVESEFKDSRSEFMRAVLGDTRWEIWIDDRNRYVLNGRAQGTVHKLYLKDYTGIWAAVRSLFESLVPNLTVIDAHTPWPELLEQARAQVKY